MRRWIGRNSKQKEGHDGNGKFYGEFFSETLDQTAFDAFRKSGPSEPIEIILQTYRDLLKTYPIQKIEDEGRIPGEMPRDMGKADLFGLLVTKAYGGGGLNI